MNPRRRHTRSSPAFRAVLTNGLASIQRFDPATGKYTHIFSTGPDTAQAIVAELLADPCSPLHGIYEAFP